MLERAVAGLPGSLRCLAPCR